jgi:hypothetical protein
MYDREFRSQKSPLPDARVGETNDPRPDQKRLSLRVPQRHLNCDGVPDLVGKRKDLIGPQDQLCSS